MAGRKLIKAQLRASSIMEVLVAMITIIIVFGIALMIYSNVLRSSLSVKRIQAQSALQEILLNIKQGTEANNQTLTVGGFQIEKEIRPYGTDGNLSEVHLTAYDDNHQKIAELQKIIIDNNGEK